MSAPIRLEGAVLKSDGTGYWTTTLGLPAWRAAFGSRRGALYVEMEAGGDDDNPDAPPAASRVEGCRWLIANEAAVLPKILAAVRARVAEARALGTIEALAKAITPTTVTFHTARRGRLPYVGFGFRCPWDEEHGLGVMMHGLRAVEVGGADVAILEWIADGDAKEAAKKGGKARRVSASKRPARRRAPR